jgi:hypothetical protein
MLFSPVPAELLDARNEIGRRPRPPRPPESDRDRAIGPATALVVPFRPKRGRPADIPDAALELAAREAEEREMAAAVLPLVRRLRLMADGPVAASTVAAIDAALTRHQRRWMPSPEGDAA